MKLYRYIDIHQIDYHAVKWHQGYRLEKIINLRQGDDIEGEFQDSQRFSILRLPDGWSLYEIDRSDFKLVINS
jgi:hypothetical protein